MMTCRTVSLGLILATILACETTTSHAARLVATLEIGAEAPNEAPQWTFSVDLDGSDFQTVLIQDGVTKTAYDTLQSTLYWSEDLEQPIPEPNGRIRRTGTDPGTCETLLEVDYLTSLRSVDVDEQGKIYFSSVGFSDGLELGNLWNIHRMNVDGSGLETIVSSPPQVEDIAVDRTNRKLYWSQDESGGIDPPSIRRSELDGSQVETVIETAGFPDRPQALFVDPAAGKLYWVQRHPKSLHRANLDGSDREMLFESPVLENIVVDSATGRVYWQVPGAIMRANLDGTDVQTIIAPPNTGEPKDMLLVPGDGIGPFDCGADVPAVDRHGLFLLAVFMILVGSALRRRFHTAGVGRRYR